MAPKNPGARQVYQNGHPTEVVYLAPAQVIVLPVAVPGAPKTKGPKLERVYLGIGWQNKEKPIDVDCAVVGYSNGERDDSNTIWYGHLENNPGGKSSIKHSGDILSGAASVDDLERIYVWLNNVPEQIDCLAFEANIFTALSG